MTAAPLGMAAASIQAALFFIDEGDDRQADMEKAARLALDGGTLSSDDRDLLVDCLDYSRSLLLREGAESSARTVEGVVAALLEHEDEQ